MSSLTYSVQCSATAARALQRDPAVRFPTIAEFIAALDHSETAALSLLEQAAPTVIRYALAFAVMLAAGLDCIRREMTVADATEENLYSPTVQARVVLKILPDSLH